MTDAPIDIVFKLLIFGVPLLMAGCALAVVIWIARGGG